MIADARPRSRFDRLLDALASRVGISLTIGGLILVCITVGLYVQYVVVQLERSQAVFEDRQVRNGYVAISDIQRLILVAQEAVAIGEMTDGLAAQFREATDILFVRTEHFKGTMNKGTMLPSGESSIQALEAIVAIGDRELSAGFSTPRAIVAELLIASSGARGHIVQFLDDMRRQADLVMEQQTNAVRQQQLVILANLVGLTIIGSVALLFLRREVLGRQARAVAEKRVAFLAFFDPLTELPNRVQFQDRLQVMLANQQDLSLLYLDLDDFKIINDTSGHATGDAVLIHVARILRHLADSRGGFAARLAGDEFAMVIPDVDLKRLTDLCDMIIVSAASPLVIEGETFEIGVSIGLATTTQVGAHLANSVDSLSRVTDFALYASKSGGRRRFTVYDETLEKLFLDRRAMLDELPKAIQNGDLEVHFQPKVNLADGVAFGFEGLVRWRRDETLVPPGDFIQLAEESGLVLEIDRFVMNRATELISGWNDHHGTEYSVSVNLSALHFNSPRITTWVASALRHSALRPDLLTLEITETVEMNDWRVAQGILSDLHDLGCKISIDDFGAGYSSLAYLRSTTADELKIDKSFVDRIEASEKARLLLSSVIEIARNLDICVLVEGIETAEQARIVHAMGASRGQGYHYGRPIPPQDAMEAAAITPPKAAMRQIG